MIVQHQSEARKRPSITALTTMWADQNISKMLVSGVAAAAATSAGFIGAGNLFARVAGTASGRGLRRKSAETWAFAGRRKSLNFSRRNRRLIGLKAGYQVKPQLAAKTCVSGGPARRRLGKNGKKLIATLGFPTQTAPPPLLWRRRGRWVRRGGGR